MNDLFIRTLIEAVNRNPYVEKARAIAEVQAPEKIGELRRLEEEIFRRAEAGENPWAHLHLWAFRTAALEKAFARGDVQVATCEEAGDASGCLRGA